MTSILNLFDISNAVVGGQRRLTCQLHSDYIPQAASLLAEGIVNRRISQNTRLHQVWLDRRATPKTISGRDLILLKDGILQNVGTPTNPMPELHLYGLVAESIWIEITTQLDTGLGVPHRVEAHDWSATDPGGDALTVYSTEDGYSFCLWESKHHLANAKVRETVNSACRQVQSRAGSYLARFSVIAQQLADEDLARFYGQLNELWVDHAPNAGVGITVGTDASADSTDCFGNMASYFGLDQDQHDGQLHIIGDYVQLAETVRQEIWKGCGLWIGP